MSNPYKNLASAIVLQAIDDTIRAIQGRNPRGYSFNGKNHEDIIQENYKFFRSTWFACLTDIESKINLIKFISFWRNKWKILSKNLKKLNI